uniref:CSON012081 protein n=1 Tax=Culicoides sonorensis TaxID=179676 RepID=A0A336KKT7_CULSO
MPSNTRRSQFLHFLLLITFFLICISHIEAALEPRAPNFQYFERPKYRYPYYDEHGRGKLLYGYGGPELYQWTAYTPLEGIH